MSHFYQLNAQVYKGIFCSAFPSQAFYNIDNFHFFVSVPQSKFLSNLAIPNSKCSKFLIFQICKTDKNSINWIRVIIARRTNRKFIILIFLIIRSNYHAKKREIWMKIGLNPSLIMMHKNFHDVTWWINRYVFIHLLGTLSVIKLFM